ncbi:hypothetical protein BAFK78_D011 (plasmid) [Borreliella afzelii K78]|nr:hypothetical protein BAFK78_D011 [Borreliella afzelii K78]
MCIYLATHIRIINRNLRSDFKKFGVCAIYTKYKILKIIKYMSAKKAYKSTEYILTLIKKNQKYLDV